MYCTDEIKVALISNLAEKIILAKITHYGYTDHARIITAYYEAELFINTKIQKERELAEQFKKDKEDANL